MPQSEFIKENGDVIKIIKEIPTGYVYPVYLGPRIVESNAQIISSLLQGLYGMELKNMVCRGTSGIIIATAIQRYLNSNICNPSIHYVRKETEKRHSDSSLWIDEDEYSVIVDDFVSSGQTMIEIYTDLNKYHNGTSSVRVIIAIDADNKVQNLVKLFPNLETIIC